MDIAEFYDADARRRSAEERSFGMDWCSAQDPDHRWDLFWNSGTGELYLMAKPVRSPWIGWHVEDAKDDMRALRALEHRIVGEIRRLIHPRQVHVKTGRDPGERYKEALEEELTVEVLRVIDSEDQVVRLLDGWEKEVDKPDSLRWLKARVSAAS